MTDKDKIQKLKMCYEDIVWMAIRYAHGRHTYAPSMVRNSVNVFKEVFPEWELRDDITIELPNEDDIGGFKLRDDYLDDLFSE